MYTNTYTTYKSNTDKETTKVISLNVKNNLEEPTSKVINTEKELTAVKENPKKLSKRQIRRNNIKQAKELKIAIKKTN